MQPKTDTDLIIRVSSGRAHARPDDNVREYDATVYANVPLTLGRSTARGRTDDQCRGLPLRGVAPLRIKWSRYQDLLAQFFEGEKGLEAMYYRMRDTLSGPLQDLVDHLRASEQPLRIWWANDAPELDDMPWDLLFYGQYGDRMHDGPARTSCVRGLPPAVPPPLLAVSGPLRVLWDEERTPYSMRSLFQSGIPNMVGVPFRGAVRDALVRARAEGFEVLHLGVDGIVSLAYEGVLYSHGEHTSMLSATDVSQVTAGSRLSLLSLTPDDRSSSDTVQIANRDVVSVYRAFACFAAARVTLPSMVVPAGPTPNEKDTERFWTTFYRELSASHDAEKSLAQARHDVPASPHSLFLRHAQGKLFRTADRGRRSVEHPERLTMQVRGFAEATTQAQAIEQRYGKLPTYLQDLLSDQQERHAHIEADLEDWARPEGENE